MRRSRRFHVESLEGRVVLSTVPSSPVLGAAIVANQAPTPPLTTDQMLRDVMGDEAFAYATYRAYAAAAQQRGDKELASVWNTTADVELQEHFTEEAKLAGLVSTDNATNLIAAIKAETAAINTYKQDAAQAGSGDVGNTFTEIARDEAAHLALFNGALLALLGQNNGVVPSGPTVEPTKIVPSEPAASGQTLDNIRQAARDEAFAYAEYTLFARQAVNTGQPQLADLFTAIAKVELKDHFAKEANLAGLVGSNTDNLKASITDETGAAAKYQNYALIIKKDNPASPVATLFLDNAQDELGHAKSFQVLLNPSSTTVV